MAVIRRVTTAEASGELIEAIRSLVAIAFGHELSDEDWHHTLGGRHVVITERGVVVAHAAVVPRVLHIDDQHWRAGYLEGVATAPRRRGEGLGSIAIAEATELVRRDFELGALSTGRHDLYARLGWQRWQGPTFVRDGNRRRRTPDDDGDIMVLRHSPSRNVDLTAAISCEPRPGDDW